MYSGEDYCTLVTCTPYGVNTHRLLVRGTRIPYEEAEIIVEEIQQEEQPRSNWEEMYTVPIDLVSDAALIVPGIDVVLIRQLERAEQFRQATAMIAQFKDKLTETQFRRLCLYFINEMSIDQIGIREGVTHQAVSLTINAAIKKINKYF